MSRFGNGVWELNESYICLLVGTRTRTVHITHLQTLEPSLYLLQYALNSLIASGMASERDVEYNHQQTFLNA
jgi:hypothetical protein